MCDLADANLVESIREHARWQSPCQQLEEDGLLLVAGVTDLPGGYKNCAARVDPDMPAHEAVARAKEFFRSRNRGFSMLVRASRDLDLEAALKEEGFVQRSEAPCMLIDAPVSVPEIQSGLRLEAFSEERHIKDAASVNAEAYQALGLPATETHAMFADCACVAARKLIGCVAYRGRQPLATALAIKSPHCAGVYWVGTAVEAQRMGLASLCTAHVTNAAFADGAEVLTLQASALGEPVYQRLGYRTYDRMKWFRYTATAR
jgi:ribosomal protein S18 acetylase RimI-like enzyme